MAICSYIITFRHFEQQQLTLWFHSHGKKFKVLKKNVINTYSGID